MRMRKALRGIQRVLEGSGDENDESNPDNDDIQDVGHGHQDLDDIQDVGHGHQEHDDIHDVGRGRQEHEGDHDDERQSQAGRGSNVQENGDIPDAHEDDDARNVEDRVDLEPEMNGIQLKVEPEADDIVQFKVEPEADGAIPPEADVDDVADYSDIDDAELNCMARLPYKVCRIIQCQCCS